MRLGFCQILTIGSLVGLLTLVGCGRSESIAPEVSSESDTTLVSKSPAAGDLAAGDLAAGDLAAGDLAAGNLAAGNLAAGNLADQKGTRNETAAAIGSPQADGPNKPVLVSESEHIQRFDNGQIKRRFEARTYSNNEVVFHGRYVEYYPNGQRFKQGMYVDGKQDGLWGYWHENGRIAKKGKFIEGAHDGIWIYKTDRGYMRRQESYQNGLKDGLWIVYGREPGTKIREENWQEDKRHGVTTEFNPKTGKILMVTEWVHGKKHGKEQIWHEDGSKAVYREYQNDELHGRAVVWAPSGAVRTDLRYVHGVRQSD